MRRNRGARRITSREPSAEPISRRRKRKWRSASWGEGCALAIGPRAPIADTGDNIRELTEQAAAYSGGRTTREQSRESPSRKLCWLRFSRSGRANQGFG